MMLSESCGHQASVPRVLECSRAGYGPEGRVPSPPLGGAAACGLTRHRLSWAVWTATWPRDSCKCLSSLAIEWIEAGAMAGGDYGQVGVVTRHRHRHSRAQAHAAGDSPSSRQHRTEQA